VKRRVLVLLLAALLAVAGALLVLYYVSRADERALAGQEPTDVYVATEEIPSGTTLEDAERQGLLELTQVPRRSTPVGALTEIDEDNQDLLALGDVTAGEILLAARFGTTPTGERALDVPPGRLAVSIELNDPARVGTFVTPGSHLVVYRQRKIVSLAEGDRADKINEFDLRRTQVLIKDVLVIGMGDTPLAGKTQARGKEDAGAADEPSFLVTLAVTPKQALRLTHEALGQSPMYAALRGSDVTVDPNGSISDLDPQGALR
jgi:pilus assembly protein CpaB